VSRFGTEGRKAKGERRNSSLIPSPFSLLFDMRRHGRIRHLRVTPDALGLMRRALAPLSESTRPISRAGEMPKKRRVRAGTRPAEPLRFVIRPAELDDYDGLCLVLAEGDVLHSRSRPDVFRGIEGPVRSREYISEAINDDDAALLVAESRGEIVGAVHAQARDAPENRGIVPRRFAVIDDIVVKKPFRRKGIGQALMRRAQQWAKAKGLSQIELNVWEFNRSALALYRKLGYRTARRRLSKLL